MRDITPVDTLSPTVVDYNVEPILCGPIGSTGDVSHGTPRDVDYFMTLCRDSKLGDE